VAAERPPSVLTPDVARQPEDAKTSCASCLVEGRLLASKHLEHGSKDILLQRACDAIPHHAAYSTPKPFFYLMTERVTDNYK
jgi:hypothetical protein